MPAVSAMLATCLTIGSNWACLLLHNYKATTGDAARNRLYRRMVERKRRVAKQHGPNSHIPEPALLHWNERASKFPGDTRTKEADHVADHLYV